MSDLATIRYGNRIGETVGDLTLIGISARRGDHNRILGEFACSCGGKTVAPLGRVFGGTANTHCGCKTERGGHKTHGMRNSPEYSSWQAMKARCLDPNNKDYPRWGGRGVTVYPEWAASFQAFFDHIGPRPHGTSLDRIDNRIGYCPGNVRWATATEQQRNRFSSYLWHIKGHQFETHTEAATAFNVSEHTIWRWVNGQFDRRRNTYTQPRSDCYVVSRY